jgi:hypothetical protein
VSPPLPRQNAKVQPPSPPPVIQDKTGSLRYQRMSFLGEVRHISSLRSIIHPPYFQGGFARVYQVRDSRNNQLACKVVTKSSLKTKKAKTKVCTSYPQLFFNANRGSSFTQKLRSTKR